jgi:anti-sigma regulatory factor (Ser/Thr protein kinase)
MTDVIALGPEDVGRSRAAVRQALGDRPAETVAAAVLLTSELVTNALLYGSGVAELEIDVRRDRLRVAVADPIDTGDLVPLDPAPDVERGRGLAIVDALSSDWGVGRRNDGGKVVWFELGL